MAITYIKLGPIGDLFNSDELGIYLDKKSSAEVDLSLLTNRLNNFYQSGFLVEITKVEHDNIKLKNSSARNIPLIVIPIAPTYVIEPAENVLSVPPLGVFPKNRFVVAQNAQGPWKGYEDYIAEFNGTNWVFTKPQDGYIVPIYFWGISIHYVGTYPSGYWDYNEAQIVAIGDQDPGTGETGDSYALQLFILERDARIKRDLELTELINQLSQNPSIIKAITVSIEDAGGFYESSNVELALQEIAQKLRGHDIQFNELYQILANLSIPDIQAIRDRIEYVYSLLTTESEIRDSVDQDLQNQINALSLDSQPGGAKTTGEILAETAGLTIAWESDIVPESDPPITYQQKHGDLKKVMVQMVAPSYLEGFKSPVNTVYFSDDYTSLFLDNQSALVDYLILSVNDSGFNNTIWDDDGIWTE